jgi:hypothetical protein
VPEQVFYNALLVVFIVFAPLTAAVLLWVPAPYGRYHRSGFGPAVRSTLGWVIMELPAVLVFGLCFLLSGNFTSIMSWLYLGLWEFHYIYRALIFPFLRRGGRSSMPLLVIVLGMFFNITNGYLNGRWVFMFASDQFYWLSNWRLTVGVLLFLLGFAVHVHSDLMLFRLREAEDTGYQIPNEGLHCWVAAPNYLGEIIEWIGWALATRSPAGLAFALWTIANLAPRARAHQTWYRRTFNDYPAHRRALIPMIW